MSQIYCCQKRRFDLGQSLEMIVRQGGEMIGKDGGSRRGSIPGPQRRGTQGTRISSLEHPAFFLIEVQPVFCVE
jgi:hypothetical protein